MYRSVFRSAPRTAAVVVWAMRDQLVEVRSWIDELMPRRRLPGRPRTKRSSSGSAAVTGIQLGDDTAALAARRRLERLLAVIDDPYPRPAHSWPWAWSSPIVDDYDGALREASLCREHLRDQDEPLWTAVAIATLGEREIAVARHDEALGHLMQVRELTSSSTTRG